ncbi:MAG: flagellar hook-associated protein FlgK [Candidatus Hydrogenedentota bacterium]
MVSPFFGLEIAKRGLEASRKALDVISHNIANANNPDYSRQEITLSTTDPVFLPALRNKIDAGMLGSGVEVAMVDRIIDPLLSQRIGDALQKKSGYEEETNILKQLEDIFAEPSDNGIRTAIDNFFLSWNELSKNPESMAARAAVRESGQTLGDVFRDIYTRIQDLGGVGIPGDSAVETAIYDAVDDINRIGLELSEINSKIKAIEITGDNPNDYLDTRDALIRELSEIVDVSTSQTDEDEFRVLIAGQVLVQGNLFNEVSAIRNSVTDHLEIFSNRSNYPVYVKEGRLAILQEMAYEYIPEVLSKLDTLAESIVTRVNDLHRAGFGMDEQSPSTGINFFQAFDSDPDSVEVYSVTGSQTIMFPEVPLNGDTTDASVPENFEYDNINSGSLLINGYQITYDADNDTILDIISRINSSNSGVIAWLDPSNRLVLKATKDSNYEIQTLRDTGTLLEKLGITVANGTIPGSQGPIVSRTNDGDIINVAQRIERPPSLTGLALYIEISDEVMQDLSKIAAAKGTDTDLDGDWDETLGPTDGSNALAISELRNELVMSGDTASFSTYYNSLTSEIAVKSATAKSNYERSEDEVLSLKNLRESISGVSIDEELTNLIKFQRGFEANARVIRTQNEILQILMTIGE